MPSNVGHIFLSGLGYGLSHQDLSPVQPGEPFFHPEGRANCFDSNLIQAVDCRVCGSKKSPFLSEFQRLFTLL